MAIIACFCPVFLSNGDDIKLAVLDHPNIGKIFLNESELKIFNEFMIAVNGRKKHMLERKESVPVKLFAYAYFYWTYHYNPDEDPVPKLVIHTISFDVDGYPCPKDSYFLDRETAEKISKFNDNLLSRLRSTNASVDTEKRKK